MKTNEFKVKTSTVAQIAPEYIYITGEGNALEGMDQVMNSRTQEKLIVDKADSENEWYLLKRLNQKEDFPLIDILPGDSLIIESRIKGEYDDYN